MTDHIQVQVDGGVQMLTLNRPEKKNALTNEMYEALGDGLVRAEHDPSIRVTLITGSSDSFSAGSDIAIFAQANTASDEPDADAAPNPLVDALMKADKPVIAAVNGMAVGIGVTVLLHCDIVYAAQRATFQMPFVNLGLIPEAASSLLLPRLVGMQKATELLLTGRRIDAREAEAIGLVAAVIPDDELLEEAMRRAQLLAAQPPTAVKITKGLLRGEDRAEVTARGDLEYEYFSKQLRSAEVTEAIAAFFERRPADFSKLS